MEDYKLINLKFNKEKLIKLCEKHKVQELCFFGSVLTDKFNKDSDIDIIVIFDNVELNQYFINYMSLKEKLEILFNRDVDLLEKNAIKNPIFKKIIERDQIIVYERKGA